MPRQRPPARKRRRLAWLATAGVAMLVLLALSAVVGHELLLVLKK